MSSEEIYLPQWSVLDGYFGDRHTPPLQSISTHQIFSLLQQQALLPITQKSLSQLWCTKDQYPRMELHQILRSDQSPSSARILALDVLSCHAHRDDLPILWEVFMRARFGFFAEDPDLFTRSLRTIIKIEERFPQSNKHIFSSLLPTLFQESVFHRDQIDIPIHIWTPILEKYYHQHGKNGLYAFTSEGGSLFQEIITLSQQDSPSAPLLPKHRPGYHQEIPIPKVHLPDIKQYHSTWNPSFIFTGLCGLLLSILLFQRNHKRSSTLLFGLSLLCCAEGVLELLDQPTYAQEKTLFSFIDFSFQPYEIIERPPDRWWISQGGPARWQEIPIRDEIFRIAVLGASSAHASNLLQEESFAALLEQQLQSEFPDKPIQVVNMAIGGTISNGILSSGIQALKMGADAIIIYYGHNEVAQFQQLTQFSSTDNIPLRIFFSQSRIYNLLHAIVPISSLPNERLQSNLQPKPKKIIEWATQNHRQNIGVLLQSCLKNNVPVLQISPTYNFRFAPFEQHYTETNLSAIQALEKAKYLRPQDPIATKEHLKKAIQHAHLGSEVSIMAYRILAEILSEEGKDKQARILYQNVFDQSSGITTIHSNIKNNIQDLAQEYGTALLPAEDVFYHNSEDGLTANGLFWDELHPNALGHKYLAEAVIPWAKEQTSNFLGSSPSP